jgi:hypothetical protein
VAYTRTLVSSARGDQLLLGPRLGLAFPTSLASRNSSVYFRGSLGAGVDLYVPLLMHGEWRPGLLFTGAATWESNLVKTLSGGSPYTTDVAAVGLALIDQNQPFALAATPGGGQVTATLGAWLTLYRGLSLGNTWGFAWQYFPSLSPSGCLPMSGFPCPVQEQGTPHETITIFDVALAYTIADVVWVALGYDNQAPVQHGTGASHVNLFDSVDARFYGQVAVLFDGIYAKATSPPAPAQ